MSAVVVRAATHVHIALIHALARGHRDQRGEGVISAAIAVLIMAFLGAAMWLAFKGMFSTATDNTRDQLDQIGR